MGIPFVDLKGQYQALREDIDARIRRVLDHGSYILGPEVEELETALASYVGVRHAVGCSSGTDALLLPLMALGIGPGDAVFTTPFTFIATAEVISLVGATPVFVDIDPLTWNLSPEALDRAVRAVATGDTSLHPVPAGGAPLVPRGVIAVDLYGLPADYDALQKVCDAHGLFLVEDAAQSFGAQYRGRRAGSFGAAAGTSFFPAKPLGGYGDGGMVFTQRDDLAETMRSLRVHGKGTDKYDNVRVGLNARLDTLQAAIVLAKFAAFPGEMERRQAVADRYGTLLGGSEKLRVPVVPDGSLSAWAQYTVNLPGGRRPAVEAALRAAGVPTAVYYPKPLHLQAAFRHLGYREGDFPHAEAASAEVLSLPFGPYLSEADAERVAQSVLSAL